MKQLLLFISILLLNILNITSVTATDNYQLFIYQGLTSVLFLVIGFFLVRYIKSVDKKLEILITDVNDQNLKINTITLKNEEINKDFSETKTIVNQNNIDIIELKNEVKNNNKLIEKIDNITNNCVYKYKQ